MKSVYELKLQQNCPGEIEVSGGSLPGGIMVWKVRRGLLGKYCLS